MDTGQFNHDLRYFEWLCQYFPSGLDDHQSFILKMTTFEFSGYLEKLREAVNSKDVATYQ